MSNEHSIGPWDQLVAGRTVKGLLNPSCSEGDIGARSVAIRLEPFVDDFMSQIWGHETVPNDPNQHLQQLLNAVKDWESTGDLDSDVSGYRAAALCSAHGLICAHRVAELISRGEFGYELLHAWNDMAVTNMDARSYWLSAEFEQGGPARSELASKAARARHAKSGKSAAKQLVFECWKAWVEKPSQYKNNSNFARAMLDKFEELESQAVIERWVRDWRETQSK